MSRKVYISASGSSKNVPKLYVGVSSVARKIKVGYIGVSGSARVFYRAAPVYVWNRYNIATVTSYTEVHQILYNSAINEVTSARGATQYTFDASTGLYTIAAEDIRTIDTTSRVTRYCTSVSTRQAGGVRITGTSVSPGSHNQIYCATFAINAAEDINVMRYSAQQTSSQSQGSYIDQITSENRSAYPDNGISGSYWYVYQGET